jgi:hypothetical protein
MPLGAMAQTPTPPTPAAPAAPAAKPHPTMFRGKLEAVDKSAMTITVGSQVKRVVTIDPVKTKLTKNGKTATLDDGVVGEDVTVSYIKTGDGASATYTARYVSFGSTKKTTPAAPPAPAAPAPAK